MHEIQLAILANLFRAKDGLKYAEAKPNTYELENDLYNYHLQKLVKDEYAIKDPATNKYLLTKKGLIESTKIDSLGRSKEFVKASVLMGLVIFENNEIKVLSQERKRHPLYGDIGIHAGTIKYGERILDAAKRKFQEETGLLADFKFYGTRRKIMKFEKGEILSDSFFHLCFAENYTGQLIEENEFGRNFWSNIDEVMQNESKTRTPNNSLIEIYKYLKKNKSFNGIELFHEDVIVLNSAD